MFTASKSFAKGVSVGVECKAPRTPAVFSRKVHWRKYDDVEGDREDWRDDYMSAWDHADVVEAQFMQEAELGAMLKVEASKVQS